MFLREHLFELGLDEYRPLGDPTKFLDALATLFSRAKDEDVSPEAFLAHAGRLAARGGGAAAAAADGDRRRSRTRPRRSPRRRAGAASWPGRTPSTSGCWRRTAPIDFGDQVSLALRLLRESPAAREQVQARFRYVLVDEFQDTNRAQAELVALVAQRHRNVTVVGDDDQSIYKFRGAAISNILEFRERYRNAQGRGPAAELPLARRRSWTPPTASSATTTRTASRSAPGSSRSWSRSAAATARPPVRHEAFASGAEEADWIAADIARRIREGGAPAGRRDPGARERGGGPGAALAEPRGDPVAVLRHQRPVRAAGGPAPAVLPARRRGPERVRGRLRARRVRAVRAGRRGPRRHRQHGAPPEPERVRDPRGAGPPAGDPAPDPGDARRAPRGWSRTCAPTSRSPTSGRPARCCTRSCAARGWLKRLAETETVAAEEALSNIARFFDIVRAQSALLADDRAVFVARHLQTLIQAGDDPPTADIDPDADAVAVMTVHKAKGLEFPVVYLPGLVTGRFPATGRREPLALPLELVNETLPEGDYQLQEERRLFYVGMTRARDELVLSHAADYGGQRARRVSPFVLEALDLPVAAGASGARRGVDVAAGAPGRACERPEPSPAAPRSRGRRAADALVLRDRRLPDLPAQVQVRATCCGCRSRPTTRSSTARRSTPPSPSSTSATPAATS